MSMMSGMGRAFEVGETVASFKEYDGALKAVSKLIASEVPAADIAIVGTALRSVEKVTGRLGYAQAAWSGAVNGVLLGLLFSAMVVIWSPGLPVAAFIGMMFVGIAIGMLFRLISYAVLRRRRDFASVMQVTADHYEVTVLARSTGKARQVLGGGSSAPAPAAALGAVPAPVAPTPTEPPRYGVRVDNGVPAAPAVPEHHAPEPHVPADPPAPASADDEPARDDEPDASRSDEPRSEEPREGTDRA